MTGIGKLPEQHVKSSDISKSCADPGSFVRGGATKLCRRFFCCFFLVGERIQIPLKAGHHRLASETPFKWRFGRRPIMVQHLIFMIYQGIRASTSIAKKPYSFVIFQGGGVSLDPRI